MTLTESIISCAAMRPNLTNKQRAFLGLKVVQPDWQAEEWLPETVFYHDETFIHKIIRYYPTVLNSQESFDEADYSIALTPDKLMLPKSGRGKYRAITTINVEKYAPTGCKFWYDGTNRFQAMAPHYAFIPIKGRGEFGSWAVVSTWLDQWIARLPAYLPEYYAARLAAPLPAVQYQPGDVVAFSLSNGAGYGFCRILLDTNRLDEAGWLRNPPDYTGGFHYLRRIVTPLLIAEVLDLQKVEPMLTDVELLAATRRPPMLLSDGSIFKGCLPIVAHQPVEPSHLNHLPEAFEELYQNGPHGYHYQWGIVSVIVPSDDWLANVLDFSRKEFPHKIRPLAEFDSESAFLNPEKHFQPWPDGEAVAACDLRHPRYRQLKAHVMAQLGLPATISYDEFSQHFGYPTRQELVELQAVLPFNRQKWRKWWG
jgi:hypothetical protein